MVSTQAGVDLESFEYDRAMNTYRSRYDKTTVSPRMAVVATLSKVTERCPMDLPPLGETIDTDALDQLVRGTGDAATNVSVTFSAEGHTVTVHESGEIAVVPLTEDPTG